MKKEITKIFGMISIFLLGTLNAVVAQTFGGGTGLDNDPYIITTAEHLNNVRMAPAASYVIQNDLDLSAYQEGEGWVPLPNFSGHLDGQGHTIKNLKVNRPAANYQGLFAQIVPNEGCVENLNVSGSVTGASQVGGITGICLGTIRKCSFTGIVEGNTQYAGGIAGMINSQGPNRAVISYCFNSATVGGVNSVGGIVGFVADATVQNCQNSGAVNQRSAMAGGIVGFNNNGIILNCFNEGKIGGKEDVGGIVGFTNPGSCSVNKCYNAGNVEGTAHVGGIVGRNAETVVSGCIAINRSVSGTAGVTGRVWGRSLGSTSCYSDNLALDAMRVNGIPVTSTDATSQNGVGKTLSEARTSSTYESELGWDFNNDWAFVTGFNPLLKGIAPLPDPLFEGGKGIDSDPYILSEPIHLDNVRKRPSECFLLQNDLDLSGYQEGEGWIPIPDFSGRMNGNGFTVKNLKINRPNKDYQGLIGSIRTDTYTESCVIENLNVSGEITGSKSVGGLVGTNDGGDIRKCSFSGTVQGKENVGGLVGSMYSGTSLPEENRSSIVESYNHASVSTQGTGGGLVGLGSYIRISRCYNSGPVTAQYGYIGGIIGSATGWNRGEGPGAEYGGTTVSDCYNTGSIRNGYKIGGIAGLCNVKKTSVTNSYSTGTIVTDNEDGKVGGIAGSVSDARISGCVAGSTELQGIRASRIVAESSGNFVLENNYALSSMLVNGERKTSGGLTTPEGQDKTIGELKQRSTYESLGWDYTEAWEDVPGHFPVLKLVSEIPQETFAGGSGTSDDPYVITDATHLNNVRTALDAHYVMEADVDLSEYQEDEGWTPIATANTTGFLGTFNGKGHKISNLKINRPEKDGQSLFGYARNAVIDSIDVENASVTGKNKVALIVSHGINMGIRESKVSGTVQGAEYVAGIIGYSEKNGLTKCTNEARVTGLGYLAGIAGLNNGGITECLNTGTVQSTAPDENQYKYIAGIASYNHQGSIQKCVNQGEIISNVRFVGGILGISSEGSVVNCQNTGRVKGYRMVGGICGMLDQGKVEHSSNSGMIQAKINLAGVVGNAWKSTVNNCFNEGEVKGPEEDTKELASATGGILGVNDQSTTTSCRNEGPVSGFDFVGGIAGANTGIIVESSNTGSIKAVGEYAGGIAGTNSIWKELEDTYIARCYNTGSIESGKTSAGGIAGVNSSRVVNNCNSGFVSGVMANGGIVGLQRTVAGGVVEVMSCLNLGNVQGTNNGGILGYNGYSGQATFNVTANERVDGQESYRVIGGDNPNNMNYIDNNLALETMLVNGIRVDSDNPMSFDGKGTALAALLSEDTYSALGWDTDEVWYATDGLSFPVLRWQPRLTTDIRQKISVEKGETFRFTLGLEKQGFEIDPMEDITWGCKDGIKVTSSDNLEYTVTGTAPGTTLLTVELKDGNILNIPVEVTDGSGIGENKLSGALSVYPIPADGNGILTVDLTGLGESLQSVSLYDLSSRLVESLRPVNQSRISVPLENLASGTYILKVMTESGRSMVRNIVVK